MTKREIIIPKGMEDYYDKFHYAPAVKVGHMLYVSGQVGLNEKGRPIEDPEAQFTQAFENLGRVLNAAGAGFSDLVDLQTFHVDLLGQLSLFMRVKDRFIIKDYPAWTAVGVVSLALPGLAVEIKCSALIAD
jgi:enamine deaminase RidA (YjgF/YER057c/UK114 family)